MRRRRKTDISNESPNSLLILTILTTVCIASAFATDSFAEGKEEVKRWADLLGEELTNAFDTVTRVDDIAKSYSNLAIADEFFVKTELNNMQQKIETFLDHKRKIAWDLHVSLQNKDFDRSTQDVNTKDHSKFVYYVDAKLGNDSATIEPDWPNTMDQVVEARDTYNYTPNANLFNVETDERYSAVHVPTPVYKRNPEMLTKIRWSETIHSQMVANYRDNDLSWQFFCSEQGFMRFYPATIWPNDNPDLFDCRMSEWYIAGATGNKHIVIMLDMSGSMHGQRFEIAKQTVETILETLTENDFFNIILFNRKVCYLDECYRDKLIQANMKNKKVIRAKLNNASAENKADYNKALKVAFHLLYNLPVDMVNWTSPDELREMRATDSVPAHERKIVAKNGWTLFMSKEYLSAINNKSELLNCNSAIMLITDGASDMYSETFKLMNERKRVRFFSYLIGEEATEMDEVRWMACWNRGFMVHIANLADVHEKVQYYVKVMTRPIALYPKTYIQEKKAAWSGVYFERLFRASKRGVHNQGSTMVTTVSYPVVTNRSFMGVVGVSVPISDIQQLALHHRLGINSYTFMVDNNGYALFHPQLRIMNHGRPKPNYNSIDMLELEVPDDLSLHFDPNSTKVFASHELDYGTKACSLSYDSNFNVTRWQCDADKQTSGLRLNRVCCSSKESATRLYDSRARYHGRAKNDSGIVLFRTKIINGGDGLFEEETVVLWATEDLRRVYTQSNVYYYTPIAGTMFSLVLVIQKENKFRISRRLSSTFQYGDVDLSWYQNQRWKIHPEWRYCRVNNSDSELSPEKAWLHYAKEMRASNRLPELCESRRELVDDLLLDSQATGELHGKWKQEWPAELAGEDAKKNGKAVHLVFFIGRSGLIRYLDEQLSSIQYKDPASEKAEESTTKTASEEEEETAVEPASDGNVAADDANRNTSTTYKPDLTSERTPTESDLYPPQEYFHFIDRFKEGPLNDFYKRAMHNIDRYTIDIIMTTHVYYGQETQTAYGKPENVSLVLIAGKPLTMSRTTGGGRAAIGVVGLEMLYDNLVKSIDTITDRKCKPIKEEVETEDDGKTREVVTRQTVCYLLDEHGYVIYTSQDVTYGDAFSSDRSKVQRVPLGKFFGEIDFFEARLFQHFVEKRIYEKKTYVDYQAVCPDKTYDSKGASRLLNPIYNLLRALQWLWAQFLFVCFSDVSLGTMFVGLFHSANSYTQSFKSVNEPLPCDNAANFYLLNTGDADRVWAIEDPAICGSGPSCRGEAWAKLVPGTNLLFVQTLHRGRDCREGNGTKCKANWRRDKDYVRPPSVKFERVNNASDKIPDLENVCAGSETRERRTRVHQCFNASSLEDKMVENKTWICSTASSLARTTWLSLVLVVAGMLYAHMYSYYYLT